MCYPKLFHTRIKFHTETFNIKLYTLITAVLMKMQIITAMQNVKIHPVLIFRYLVSSLKNEIHVKTRSNMTPIFML
jgi:hypothetical protein